MLILDLVMVISNRCKKWNESFKRLFKDSEYTHISDIINNGYCMVYAILIKENNRDIELLSAGGHSYIKYDGKYYDSYMFDGSNNPLDISDSVCDLTKVVVHSSTSNLIERYGYKYSLRRVNELICRSKEYIFK